MARKFSNAESIVTLANMYIGMGLLSMPYALALFGWTGVLCIISAACLMGFTMYLVGKNCLDVTNAHPDGLRPDIIAMAEEAYGKIFGYFCLLCCIVQVR